MIYIIPFAFYALEALLDAFVDDEQENYSDLNIYLNLVLDFSIPSAFIPLVYM